MSPLTCARRCAGLLWMFLLLLSTGARASDPQPQECKRERRLVVLLEKLREPYYYAEMYGEDADSVLVGTLVIKARERNRWGPDSLGSKGFVWFCQNLRTSETWSLHLAPREISVWTEAPAGKGDQTPRAQTQPAPAPKQVAAAVGYLVLASKTDAQIGVDGKMTPRHTPVSAANPIALPAGPHAIRLVDSAGHIEDFGVNIEDGKTVRLVRAPVR
jgi:hypothetical protein